MSADAMGLIEAAAGLISEHGENPEYDRAIVELTNDNLARANDEIEETRREIHAARARLFGVHFERPEKLVGFDELSDMEKLAIDGKRDVQVRAIRVVRWVTASGRLKSRAMNDLLSDLQRLGEMVEAEAEHEREEREFREGKR